MIGAVVRLLGISLVTVLGGFIALFILRQLGLSQEFEAISHPLMSRANVVIAKGGASSSAPPNSDMAFSLAHSTSPQVVLELDLRRTRDGHWMVFGHDFLEEQTEGSGPFNVHVLADIEELDLGFRFQVKDVPGYPYRDKGLRILTFEQFLAKFGARPFVVDIHNKTAEGVDDIVKLVHKYQADKHVIIQSPYPGVIKEIKKKQPLWLYGASSARLAQARIFAALFIEPLANLDADIYFMGLFGAEQPLTPRLAAELNRRKKKIYIETDEFQFLKDSWLWPSVDGVLTTRPAEALEFYHRHK